MCLSRTTQIKDFKICSIQNQSTNCLNKNIGILSHFSLPPKKRGKETWERTQNDSWECQHLHKKFDLVVSPNFSHSLLLASITARLFHPIYMVDFAVVISCSPGLAIRVSEQVRASNLGIPSTLIKSINLPK